MNKKICDMSVARALELYPTNNHIDNDLILFDRFENVPLPSTPCKTNCVIVALCMAGKAQFSINGKVFKMKTNDVALIGEGQVISDFLISRDNQGVALMLSNEFFQDFIKDVHEMAMLYIFTRTQPVFDLDTKGIDTFMKYFAFIRERIEMHESHFRHEIASAMLKAMLYDLGNKIWHVYQNILSERQTRGEKIFTDFIRLVEDNFHEERRVGWYASQMGITPKYLSETVKTISHRTPNEWIDNYVVSKLRVMLKNSTKSIKEITDEMNFSNQSFLGKYFKEHTGMSPTAYRRS